MKHDYAVSGLTNEGKRFVGRCVAKNIVDAVNQFREHLCSVHAIKQTGQAHADARIGIYFIAGVPENQPYRTNADRIRRMKDDELAFVLSDKCSACSYRYAECEQEFCICTEGILKWLRTEAEL